MVTRGIGFPVVLIPGMQGRWEWMTPTVDALAAGHRIITFSLQELRPELEKHGMFTAWTRALDEVLDRTHERQVSLIGMSFGGLIAARYAARRPERVTSLILVSTPQPRWRPRPGDAFCMRFPRLSLPYFGARGAVRLLPELLEARDNWPLRLQLGVEHARRVLQAPLEPRRTAQWVREWLAYDLTEDCRSITAPTLVITGEARLDRVVRTHDTKKYVRLIPGATHQVLAGTGHLGMITKPYRFAEMAGQFIYTAHARASDRALEEQAARARKRHAS